MSDAATPKGRVLMVVSAIATIPGSDVSTGFFLEELTHPYVAVTDAGYEVDIATISGGPARIDPVSDPRQPPSVSKVQDDIVSMGFVNSPQHMSKLDNTMRLADADLNRYDAIFFAGGAGAIFDFPGNPDVARAIRATWDAGRVVGAVCHGSAALLDVKLADGEPLVRGMTVTGLSQAEEDAIHAAEPRFTTPRRMEEEFPALGATYQKVEPDKPFVVTSGGGRLVTGQNPASGSAVGQALVAALKERARAGAAGTGKSASSPGTAKILVIDHLVSGASAEQAKPYMKAEAEHAWALMKAGRIRENYLRADGQGAVSVLECAGVDEARAIMEGFPLAMAGLISFQYFELSVFSPLEALFGEKPSASDREN